MGQSIPSFNPETHDSPKPMLIESWVFEYQKYSIEDDSSELIKPNLKVNIAFVWRFRGQAVKIQVVF